MITKEEFNEKYDMQWYCGSEPTEDGMILLDDVLTWGRRYYLLNEDGSTKKKVGHYLDNCLVMTHPNDSKRILRCQFSTRRKSERELPEEFEYTAHARKQMFLRGISDETVIKTLKFGKLIHYKDRGGNLRDAYLLDNISIGATMSDNEEGVMVIVTAMRLSPVSELNFINLCRSLKGRLGECYRYSIAEGFLKTEDGPSHIKREIWKEWEGRNFMFEDFQPQRNREYYSLFRFPYEKENTPWLKQIKPQLSMFRRLGFEGSPEITFNEETSEVEVSWPMKRYDLDCVWAWGRK